MPVIDPSRFGVSFSLKQCRNFGVQPTQALNWLLSKGWRRFRLMSYWDEIETTSGKYDFAELDRQIKRISKSGGVITLCLGVRQPRWPENHWPDWAWRLPKKQRDRAINAFVSTVVKRYKNVSAIISYQLENEALLTSFGLRADPDRSRLRREYQNIAQLDPAKPIVMTTSTSWGIPIRPPIPDVVGFSFYQVTYNHAKKQYSKTLHWAWQDRLRARFVMLLWQRPCFIHELQCEPWGPKNIWEMSCEEQAQSMSLEQIQRNINRAKNTGLFPIDLWGGEWWYWRNKHHKDPAVWETVQKELQ